MSYEYSEDGLIEQATQDVLEDLGWQVVTAWKNESFGENGLLGRENKAEVILKRYLLEALEKLNPDLPKTVYEQAIEQIVQKVADKTQARINKEKYELLKNGVPVSFTNEKGELIKKKLKVFNFNNYRDNHFITYLSKSILNFHNNVLKFTAFFSSENNVSTSKCSISFLSLTSDESMSIPYVFA